MNENREHYLRRLGIVRWELRDAGATDRLATEPPIPAAAVAATLTARAPACPEPAVSVIDPARDWASLETQVAACTQCELHGSRTRTVFGVGNRNAEWMIVGEAPGAEEDRRGEPFVGPAGELLDRMLAAAGFQRSDVFIANILKCRPPGNRDPRPEEAAACSNYLLRQIEWVQPKLLLCVGRVAAQSLLGTEESTARLRGKVHHHPVTGTPVVVTYHPAYLLRKPTEKRKAWEDLKLAMRFTSGETA